MSDVAGTLPTRGALKEKLVEDPINQIVTRQARAENKIYLRARSRIYSKAKLLQIIIVTLSVVLPVIGVLVGPYYPDVRPYVALAGLILLLLDTTLIDRLQKDRLKLGAKLQEQFDTDVFDLSWNTFLIGSRVEPEDVRALSAKPLSTTREGNFDNWYEPCVSQLPLHLARLVCQRTNIKYDARLRRKYGDSLLKWTIFFGIVLLFAGIWMGLNFPDLVMTLLVPFMPILTWALKERLQQASTAASLTNLGAEWHKMWMRALEGASVAEVTRDSRSLQDAIYQHRERSPLVFDWVYYRLRTVNEDEAHHAAEDLVATARNMLNGDVTA